MKISLIAATADNGVIGCNGQLPWHLPADLQHFKAITRGKPVIMGRVTFESIAKPLPERKNIVLSSDPSWQHKGVFLANSLEQALILAQDAEEAVVIGGAKLYQIALPLADRLYLTYVHVHVEGDSYFPKLDFADWREISRVRHAKDASHSCSFSFVNYERC